MGWEIIEMIANILKNSKFMVVKLIKDIQSVVAKDIKEHNFW